MADRLGETTEQQKAWALKKTNKKKASRAKHKKKQRTAKRKIRRRLNRINYYKTLRKGRYERKTQELCSAVEFFAIKDMDWAPTKYASNLPSEIVDWHKQEQIAYWKSRAISLELENRMLKQHLRNVYAQTIIDSADIDQPIQECRPESSNKKNQRKISNEVKPKLPEPQVKYRIEEMRKIYGNKAEKLISMETGVQLNYERQLEESKPAFWPTIPLKL